MKLLKNKLFLLLLTTVLFNAYCGNGGGGGGPTSGSTAPQGMTDSQIVSTDAANLTIGFGSGNSANAVTTNVILPSAGSNGSTITWSSNVTSAIDSNGIVTRPAPGSGNTTVVLTATVTSGSSSQTVTFTLTVIALPMPPAALSLATVDDTGVSNTDLITKQTTALTFSGTAENGTTVIVYVNGSPLSIPATVSGGTWTADINITTGDGIYAITAVATDSYGTASAVSTAINLTIDTTAPLQTSLPDLAATDDTGISNIDNITRATAISSFVTISGTAEAGTSVQLFKNGLAIGLPVSADPAAGGAWSVMINSVDLPEGLNPITAKATDIAGNTGMASATLNMVIDTIINTPSAPVLAAVDDTGISNTDGITKNTTALTFSGTSDPGVTLQLYANALASGTTFTSTLGGTWTMDLALVQGVYSITAMATDTAGNISTTTPAYSLTVDTTPPTILSAETMDADSNGYIDHYKITFSENVNDLTFPGYISNNIGNNQNVWFFSSNPNSRLAHGTAAPQADTINDPILFIKFDEGLAPDTGNKPDLGTTATPAVTDLAGNIISQIFPTTVTESDRANPVIISATSLGETSIRIVFSEIMDSYDSIGALPTVVQDPTKYTIAGLTVSAAVAETGAATDDDVIILTTSVQTGGINNYTVSVVSAVMPDLANVFLMSPNNTAAFSGFALKLQPVATGGNTQVTLSWPAVAGVTSYNLYWSQTPGVTITNGTKIANVTSPYIHTGLTNNTPYYYIMTGVNGVNESKPSKEIWGTPVNYTNSFSDCALLNSTSPPCLSTSRTGHTATILSDGRILIAGGSGNTAEIYDPVSNSYTITGAMTTFRSFHTATLLSDGRILITGGTTLLTAEIYDPVSNTFTATGSMAVARTHHTATLLTDGRVLIAGGYDGSGITSNSAEIFDPVTNTFSATGTMVSSRTLHTATLLTDGRVLLTGGFSGNINSTGSTLGSAEIYNPVTGFFTNAPSMTISRDTHTATLLTDGTVLITGGFSGTTWLASTEIYNPATNTFASSGVMLNAHYGHTATLISGGRVMIAGGSSFGNKLSFVEIFDPVSNTFAAAGSMNEGRFLHTATLLSNGNIFIVGPRTTEIFDPVTNSLTGISAMTMPRDFHTTTLLSDGRVLIAGGFTMSGGYLASAEIFDPVSNTFTITGSMVSARRYHTATLLLDGRVLITGGESTAGYLSSAEIFNPATNTFTSVGSMMPKRCFHTATLLTDGRVFISGGTQNGTNALSFSEVFNPVTNTFSAVYNIGFFRFKHTATLLSDGRVLIAGGITTGTTPIFRVEIYDPVTNSTIIVANMATARYSHTATLLSDGRVLISGGLSTTGNLSSAEIYDPVANKFTPAGAMTVARAFHSGTLLSDGRVLLAGGNSTTGALSSGETYDPATNTFITTSPMSGPRRYPQAVLFKNGSVLIVGGRLDYGRLAEIFQ